MEIGGKQFLIDMFSQPNIEIPNEKITVNFYCPLMVKTEYNDYQYDDESDLIDFDSSVLINYEDQIRDAIEKDMRRGGDDLAEYFDGSSSLQEKLLSVRFDIENIRNEIFGCIHVDVSETLTDEEKDEIREYCIGQASDGFGEGFEQRPVKTPDGDLYISFWDSHADWFLLDDDEFEQRFSDNQEMGGLQ